MIAILAAAAWPVGMQPVPLTPDRWEIQGPVVFEMR